MKATDRRLSFVGFRPTGDFGSLTAYTTRDRRTIWFTKAPPLKAPSIRQRHQRQMFRNVARGWHNMPPAARALWAQAARRAHLFLSGYNLFLSYTLKPDRATIRTIERLSHTQLLP